ncbi:MAG: hypothetical protein QOI13_2516, partial [Paraburkholderia sp.]|nr:hypothetical protein [Paraburkholderia sp.]
KPDEAAESAGFYWVKRQFGTLSAHAPEAAPMYADQPSPNIRVAVQTNQGEKAYYSNETARKTAAMVNIPGAVYDARYTVNGLTDRFCAYANALVVLTDTPSFPDASGSSNDLPENFQRRKPW